MGKEMQFIYLTDANTQLGLNKTFVTEKELLIKSCNFLGEIDTLRPLVAPIDISEGTIGIMKLREQEINKSEQTPAEKDNVLYQLRVEYFLGLLNEGYDYWKMNQAIDAAVIGYKTSGVNLSDWISQLEEQGTALNSAKVAKEKNDKLKILRKNK